MREAGAVSPTKAEVLEVAGRDVRVTNPDKVLFPALGVTKLDVVRFFVEVGPAALLGCRDRPSILHRFPDGIEAEDFYQKRLPKGAPEWVQTALITFPSGRTATMPVMADEAHLAWHATLGCVDINPWPVRGDDVDHPDELRIDLDPIPGVPFGDVREVALVSRSVLEDHGMRGFPKTSGKRGIHVNVRIEPRWSFPEVRRAGLALAREIERRIPDKATSAWWKEERHGVFVDYNQNARDRTVASAYSIRPVPDARVSTPLEWDEVGDVEPADFTISTVPARLRERSDPGAAIDDVAFGLEPLLELAERDEREGIGDAPWPPHFPKAEGEPPRVQPSKRRKESDAKPTGRRKSTKPLVEIARAETEEQAREGLERWEARHPDVVPHLEPHDVLVDSMRGRHRTWTRIRVNLQNVPQELRPEQEPLEVDYDPWAGMTWDEEER